MSEKNSQSPLSDAQKRFEEQGVATAHFLDGIAGREVDPLARSYLAKTSSYLKYVLLMQYCDHDPDTVDELLEKQGMKRFDKIISIPTQATTKLELKKGIVVPEGGTMLELHLEPVPARQRREDNLASMIGQLVGHYSGLDEPDRPTLVFAHTYDAVAKMAHKRLGFNDELFKIDEHVNPDHRGRVAVQGLIDAHPEFMAEEDVYDRLIYTTFDRLERRSRMRLL